MHHVRNHLETHFSQRVQVRYWQVWCSRRLCNVGQLTCLCNEEAVRLLLGGKLSFRCSCDEFNAFMDCAVARAVIHWLLIAEGPGSFRGHSVWDLWCTKWHCDRFLFQDFVFPCRYRSTSAPNSSSPTSCSYQDKGAKRGNLPKSSALFHVGGSTSTWSSNPK
jgi:hypothetical protein